MSCSLWRWTEACEGNFCCGDCDLCDREDEEEDNEDGNYQKVD